ncbi:hypothetical protein BATDEDRAFT_84982 [Batrachochytrium dendrobatidis JAM81]|uniref:Spindle pole body component n=3 Tax=Batrachochytrium dendrobatidis TaxID=109871 RepID=F4NSM6_BATDJ|nr:uncharacterized protein BATDEDRAFT_84982 [Batrachochytrium dendrobatidis JAM81]EGF84256.1 hypothetical protein BATDEDRAFT_84982 [Batrachochytrium dendrobatidis JAM81]OAJ37024.1 hypothetical protein BDEG_21102 [Batrachochytrium dendrobatidis JEL423]|eukprot:XP_006676384.1 hypothetical protein BATDEDRAFT_84982 [Batrachochytrium dendrobatidis JAM81]
MSDRTLKMQAGVAELLAYLGIDEEPEHCLDVLSKQRHGATPLKSFPSSSSLKSSTTTYPLAERIALNASLLNKNAPTRFASIYERLCSQNNRELEPILYILSQIQESNSVSNFKQSATASTPSMHGRLRSTASMSSIKDHASQLLSSKVGVTPRSALEHLLGQKPTKTPDHRRLGKSRSVLNVGSLAKDSSSIASETMMDGSTLAFTPIQPVMTQAAIPKTSKKTANIQIVNMKAPLERMHCITSTKTDQTQKSVTSLLNKSSYEQETLIIEDLLYVLMGINGEYIHQIESSNACREVPKFFVDERLEPSIMDMVTKILPLAGYYILLDECVEKYTSFEYGRIYHALFAAIRSLLEDYLVLIGQIEHLAHTSSNFTLQKLWYYLAPSIDTMASITSLAVEIYEANNVSSASMDEYDIRHVVETNHSTGNRNSGRILGILAARMVTLSGNPELKKLHGYLLSLAAVPYLSILNTWILCGELDDPFHEFMVEEHAHLSKDKLREDFNDVYWEQRYILSNEATPTFLEPWKEKILFSGKYLNVLRECGIEIPKGADQLGLASKTLSSGMTDVVQAIDGGMFIANIEQSFLFANKSLIDLLTKDYQLIDRLKSLKQFFLFGQSDYLTHFLDLAAVDLMKPASQVPHEKVRSLLELVIGSPSSCCSTDPFKDDVTVELNPTSLFQQLLRINSVVGLDVKKHFHNMKNGKGSRAIDPDQSFSAAVEDGPDSIEGLAGVLTGIEAFALGYKVAFPLSLVINRKVLTKYQMIFRQLFLCKYIERLLSSTWIGHNQLQTSMRGGSSRENPGNHGMQKDMALIRRMSLLRERMLHFIKMFMYYVFFDVLEPNWIMMEALLRKATTVNQVLESHDDFLNSCLKECMLTHPKLIKVFSNMIGTCHAFVEFSESYTRSKTPGAQPRMSIHNRDTLAPTAHPGELPDGFVTTTHLHTHLSDTLSIRTFEDNFLAQVQKLIDVLQILGVTETPRLSHLLSQLDFNAFYSRLPNCSVHFVSSPTVPSRMSDSAVLKTASSHETGIRL